MQPCGLTLIFGRSTELGLANLACGVYPKQINKTNGAFKRDEKTTPLDPTGTLDAQPEARIRSLSATIVTKGKSLTPPIKGFKTMPEVFRCCADCRAWRLSLVLFCTCPRARRYLTDCWLAEVIMERSAFVVSRVRLRRRSHRDSLLNKQHGPLLQLKLSQNPCAGDYSTS